TQTLIEKSSNWDIRDFFNECSLGSYQQKIEEYILSSKTIINSEKGQKWLAKVKKEKKSTYIEKVPSIENDVESNSGCSDADTTSNDNLIMRNSRGYCDLDPNNAAILGYIDELSPTPPTDITCNDCNKAI
ncbi:12513_t:CDS:2, partial [Dentiscutata erythropus]